MKSVFSLLPEQASTVAGQVDSIYLFLVAVSIFCMIFAGLLVLFFSIRYRRRAGVASVQPHEDSRLEIFAGVCMLVLLMTLFGWGAKVYFHSVRPPADAMEIMVTGKQWMWKMQHPQGKREINELHVPVGRPIQLTMTSEDVIHSFFIPAFRIKQDVLPGRYTRLWFEATKVGRYHIFCAEYCGTEHSMMGGWVTVMQAADYERWLGGEVAPVAGAPKETPADAGAKLFEQLGCTACHSGAPGSLGPDLAGLPGSTVKFTDGTEAVADDDYLRESILDAQTRIVQGYLPVMPVFRGTVTEDQVIQLIAYIKSLSGGSH